MQEECSLTGPTSFADYKEALLFLTTAGVVVPLFRRLRISPVIGFLAAGVVLGPFGLGRLGDSYPILSGLRLENHEKIAEVAEFGVVFLLFMIGLELSYERLMRMKKLVFGLGAAQVVICAVAIGALAALIGPNDLRAEVIIGAALALSSTAVVIPVLAERRRLGTTAGRATFAVLLFQDLMVAPLLFGVTMMAQKGEGSVGAEFLYAVLPAIAVLGLLIVGGRLVLRPLFHQVAMTHSTEFFMATCLLVVIGTGIASAMGGLSMALGAFVGGLLLSETEFRREIEVTIEPFKGLLLGLFFVSVGAGLDLAAIAQHPLLILALTLGLIALKAAIIVLTGRAFGLPWPAAREAALMLGPGGEFAFVMLTAAIAAKIVQPDIGGQLMIIVTLSMVAIPILALVSSRQRSAPGSTSRPRIRGSSRGPARRPFRTLRSWSGRWPCWRSRPQRPPHRSPAAPRRWRRTRRASRPDPRRRRCGMLRSRRCPCGCPPRSRWPGCRRSPRSPPRRRPRRTRPRCRSRSRWAAHRPGRTPRSCSRSR